MKLCKKVMMGMVMSAIVASASWSIDISGNTIPLNKIFLGATNPSVQQKTVQTVSSQPYSIPLQYSNQCYHHCGGRQNQQLSSHALLEITINVIIQNTPTAQQNDKNSVVIKDNTVNLDKR